MVRCRVKWIVSLMLLAWLCYIAYYSYNNSLLNPFTSIPAPGTYTGAVLREVAHCNVVVIGLSLFCAIFQLKKNLCEVLH